MYFSASRVWFCFVFAISLIAAAKANNSKYMINLSAVNQMKCVLCGIIKVHLCVSCSCTTTDYERSVNEHNSRNRNNVFLSQFQSVICCTTGELFNFLHFLFFFAAFMDQTSRFFESNVIFICRGCDNCARVGKMIVLFVCSAQHLKIEQTQ